MQYLITFSFCLQGLPSDRLKSFVDCDGANIVLPSHTVGGNISSNRNNFHQLTIRFPSLNKRVTFSSSNDAETLRGNMVLYNLACSLGTCLLIHSIDMEQNQLVVQVITDNKKDFDLLKAAKQRFNNALETTEKKNG